MSYLKSVFSLTVLLFFSLSLFGQLADFDEGCVPLGVKFTAPSGSASSFWKFGNGATSTLANPSQEYIDPGTYFVEFSLTDGGAILGRDTIRVYAQPQASFEADNVSGCTPFTVNFSSTSTIDPNIAAPAINWSFGDGGSGTGENVSNTYNTAGTFKVGLTIESSTEGCRDFIEIDDYITTQQSPPLSVDATPVMSCTAPLDVTFTNNLPQNPNYTYAWDFGNGETSTASSPGSVNYPDEGSFDAAFSITDANGCVSDTTIEISVAVPNVAIALGDTICASPLPQLITNLSDPGTYSWNFSTPASPSFSTLATPSVFFTDEGEYTITLEVIDDEGRCAVEEFIVYAELPDTDFEIDPIYTCELPNTITYTPTGSDIASVSWRLIDPSIRGGDTLYSSDPILEYFVPRDTAVYGLNGERIILTTLEVTNSRGCRSVETKLDTIHAPNARFNVDTTMGCAPLTVTFYDSLSNSREEIIEFTYLWGDGTSDTFTTNDSVTHTFTQPGEYEVVLMIDNASPANCIDTSYAVTIYVGAPVTADFTVDKTTICPGDTIQFTGTGDTNLIDAWHYTTDGERMSHCADEKDASWVFESETGMMNTSLTVLYNGCPTVIEKSNLITVNGPIAKFNYEILCDDRRTVNFSDSSYDATTLTWDFGDGDSDTSDDPSHFYGMPDDFEVILTASNPGSGCPDSRDTTMIHIRDLEAKFELEDHYCQGQMIKFDASESTDVNAACWKGYTWFPSDSRPITTQDSIIDYRWSGTDKQTLELIVEDINGCQDTLRDSTLVFKVDAVAEPDATRFCVPKQVVFTDMSTGNARLDRWEWNFGSAGTSMDRNATVTYTETPDRFVPDGATDPVNVELIVYDSLNCSDTLYFNFDFYEPISGIQVPSNTFCEDETFTYSATDFTDEGHFLTFDWFLNDTSLNNTTQAGSLTTGINIFPPSGILRVDFVEDSTGCTGSSEVIINVEENPDPSFMARDEDGNSIDANEVNCAGQIIEFVADEQGANFEHQWITGDGAIITPTSDDNRSIVSYSYGRGTFTVRHIVTSLSGCSSSVNKEYTFVAPSGFITASETDICEGQEVTFNFRDTMDVDGFEYIVEGISTENEVPFTYQFTNPGLIPVTLRFNLEVGDLVCPATDSVSILVTPIGQAANIDTTFILVKAPPEGSVIDPFPLPALPSDFNPNEVVWTQDPNLDISDPLAPVVSNFTGVRSEVFVATVPGEACSTRVQAYVVAPVEIPNIFSPNGDKNNDYFNIIFSDDSGYPITSENVIEFQIFNRWGQRVYNNETPETGWDGNYKGKRQISDVYVYKIVLRNPDGSIGEPCEGDVTLYR